jgi:hypothetical protein
MLFGLPSYFRDGDRTLFPASMPGLEVGLETVGRNLTAYEKKRDICAIIFLKNARDNGLHQIF